MAYGANRTQLVSDPFTSSISGNWSNGAGAARDPCQWVGSADLWGTVADNWNSMYYTATTPNADQYCTVTFGAVVSGASGFGGRVRVQAPAPDEACYEGWFNATGSSRYVIYEIAANNGFVSLASTGTGSAGTTGWTVTIEAEGTTLRLGTAEGGADTERVNTTDNTLTGGFAGVVLFPSPATANLRISNVAFGNIGLSVPTIGVQMATGQITVSTAAVNTTFVVSGLAFQPKAILFTTAGRATNGGAEPASTAPAQFSFGFATSTSARRTVAVSSVQGQATAAVAKNVWRNDAVIETMVGAGTVDGLLDLSAISSNGFTVIIDDAFAAATIVNWLAIGGRHVTDVAIVDFLGKATTGTTDVATGFALNTGLDDKCVIGIGVRNTGASGAIGADATIGIAVAAGNTIAQANLGGHSDDAAGTQLTCGYSRAGEFVPMLNNDIVVQRTTVNAWLSDGFQVNWAETDASAYRFSALVIKGGRWFVGDMLTTTNTTAQTEATPYLPVGLALVGSAGRAASASDTTTPDQRLSIGFAVDASNRNYVLYQDKDAATTSDVFTATGNDAMYAHSSVATNQAIDGLMDLTSFDATPRINYVMDDADPSASFVFYLGGALTPENGVAVGASAMTTAAALKAPGKLLAAGASAMTSSAVLTIATVSYQCLLVTGNPAGAGDDELQAMITAHGHVVTTRLDSQSEDYSGKDFIVICESVSAASLGTKYKTAPMPILYFSAAVLPAHGLYS